MSSSSRLRSTSPLACCGTAGRRSLTDGQVTCGVPASLILSGPDPDEVVFAFGLIRTTGQK
ncbi:hypothetical protein [Lentzea albidocapillata]|uniref:hypothetical protein n=1 Tax=Lentzea albidocapillata TaxID=40571 RepID=UPI001B80C75F